MSDLLTVEAAERLISEALTPFPGETISLEHAAGRILSQPVRAERSLPPYDRVILDGIAVRWQAGVTRYRLEGTQPAGQPPLSLGSDHTAAIAVMTGSALPEGADTVIPREDFTIRDDSITLLPNGTAKRNQHIHPEGADCAAGTLLLDAGTRLTPPEMAILAANGVAHPFVSVIPSIAIISTGDELVAPDAPVQSWQIRRSNEYALSASLARAGLTRQALYVVPDDLTVLSDSLATLLHQHDVLVLSGGVSMGQFDFVPQALAALGVKCLFHKVAQRPGKPFWFGLSAKGQPVFALPGNPVSALACCSRHVIPALLRAQGLDHSPCLSGLLPPFHLSPP
ncbi:molybdopterin molybdotransferase MoeA [Asaia prunellae]|uniref:molybdopterin molybdotransferase MoeA n=1 Tax=Asaia prunellae TaxID=610245 RepID=UPI000A4B4DDA|nr:molybdopterin molybdotransferase MoeA [Asaia prunellae]